MTKTVVVLIAMLSVPLSAADRVSDMYGHQVDILESDLVRLVEAMPADRFDFRPTQGTFDNVRTFGEQAKHTATMIYMTAAIVLQEKSPYGPGKNDNGPDEVQGKEAIVRYLKASIAYARKAVASLTEQNQLDPLKTYFGSQTRVEVAAGITFHSYNHYGQMVIYARMNGVVPPASR